MIAGRFVNALVKRSWPHCFFILKAHSLDATAHQKWAVSLFDGFGYNFALLCFAYGIFLVVLKQLKDRDFKEDAIA